MSDDTANWRDYLAILAQAGETIDLLKDPADGQARQEAYRLLFASLASGYFSGFATPDAPDFVPLVNSVLNGIGTNPDFIYGYARIDGAGAYRISGARGSGIFLLFDFAAGGLGVMDHLGPSTGVLDADTLTIGADGAFDVVLSAERPAGHAGDWFRLDLRTTTIGIRQAAYDWGQANEARLAIERLDRPIGTARLGAAEIAARLNRLAAYPRRFSAFALSHYKGLRERNVINRLEHDDWAGRGGLAGQHYFQGIFDLAPGQALLLETALPARARYWNVQLNDSLWNSIDWLNHGSSLNGGQAVLDPDGRFRAVIAAEDPGVPNWLDPAGHMTGSMMLRWTEASDTPAPTLTLLPLNEIRSALPPGTPEITPETRQQILRDRRRGAQLRRRW
jgi:hypothetical protein